MIEEVFEISVVDDVTLGKRIRKIRTGDNLNHKKYSQKEFAQLIDSTVQALSNWENGRNKPNAQRLRSIADLAGTSVDELISDELSRYEIFRKKLKNNDEKLWDQGRESIINYLEDDNYHSEALSFIYEIIYIYERWYGSNRNAIDYLATEIIKYLKTENKSGYYSILFYLSKNDSVYYASAENKLLEVVINIFSSDKHLFYQIAQTMIDNTRQKILEMGYDKTVYKNELTDCVREKVRYDFLDENYLKLLDGLKSLSEFAEELNDNMN